MHSTRAISIVGNNGCIQYASLFLISSRMSINITVILLYYITVFSTFPHTYSVMVYLYVKKLSCNYVMSDYVIIITWAQIIGGDIELRKG